ncbi:Alpha,alpha-trehalose-phosphate synthase [UDP-forming] [Shimwellia blattae]|nr:Alpha,alpha-trehalose-phosphate synthase [UDP-forming] [Shimwellia blattae]
MGRLVVVSNRISAPDDKKASAGGLAVGVLGALEATGGLWFGWSGETGDPDGPLHTVRRGNIHWASFDLSEEDHQQYYCQFSNAVLWPAFHYRLDLVKYDRQAWEGYARVNSRLADKLLPLIEPDDILWIHDYHLLPFASELRKRGVRNRIGFFLHIPFPAPDIFTALPPYARLLEQMCDYDLLGFQTGGGPPVVSRHPECGDAVIYHGLRQPPGLWQSLSYGCLPDRHLPGGNCPPGGRPATAQAGAAPGGAGPGAEYLLGRAAGLLQRAA